MEKKKKAQGMGAELNDMQMAVISGIQRFVYRCMSTFNQAAISKKTRDEKMSLMYRWANRLFDTECEITFDETIWLPDDKNSIENIIRLDVNILKGAYERYIIMIDLRKDFHDCVTVFNGISDIETDIFNIKFEEKNDKN